MNALGKYLVLASSVLSSIPVDAATLVIPAQGNVLGEVQYDRAEGGESLADIARRYDIGYREMIQANKSISPEHPVPAGMNVKIPSQFILPNVPRQGIVINLASYRLYYFPADENVVFTYPVGIGRQGWNTPLGLSKIISKQVNPSWHPTKKIHADAKKHGIVLPDEIPAGSNPLGKYALRLTWPGYLLHGTQRPEGVGSKVSAGCIRLYPEDIEQLYELVATGTQVRIVNQPGK